KALCLSAAKKEEYEAFRTFRQPSFFSASFSICMRRSARGRIIAKARSPRKGYFRDWPILPCAIVALATAPPPLS
ncbi:hypothetical protein ACL9RI_19370, partial [Janthinobacterium sp. Mn2066]|uniref:hypothetical protein n=1 Tax=Janthinobacterium sp. Mn2066 TaxID=3395264 RepID=UPI003BD3554B